MVSYVCRVKFREPLNRYYCQCRWIQWCSSKSISHFKFFNTSFRSLLTRKSCHSSFLLTLVRTYRIFKEAQNCVMQRREIRNEWIAIFRKSRACAFPITGSTRFFVCSWADVSHVSRYSTSYLHVLTIGLKNVLRYTRRNRKYKCKKTCMILDNHQKYTRTNHRNDKLT